MDASKAAQIFHDWTLAEGIMAESPVPSAASAAELALIAPVTEAGKTLLRQKRVLSVGFNEADKQIVAYTRLVPPTGKKSLALLPNVIEDVTVIYRQGNHSQAGDATPAPYGGPAYTIRQAGNNGRYTCGSSISVGNCVDAGTLTALLVDANGKFFGLSNNHVSGSCSFAEEGLPIVAPGLADVVAKGLSPFTLGLHANALPMALGSPTVVAIADNTDAAIFEIIDPQKVSSYQGDAYDTPAGCIALAAGLNVEKVGRTTGHTHGKVTSQIFGPAMVNYVASNYGFTGRIYFDNVFVIEGNADAFSDNGDSGSLITTMVGGTRHAVGIVFAGADNAKAAGGKITLALPIEPILQKFGLTLVTGHNI